MQTLTLKKPNRPDPRVEFSRAWQNRLTPEQSLAVVRMVENIDLVGDVLLLVRMKNGGMERVIDIPAKSL